MLEAWQSPQPWPHVFPTALFGSICSLERCHFQLSAHLLLPCLQGLFANGRTRHIPFKNQSWGARAQFCCKKATPCHMPERWHLINLLGPKSSCHRHSGPAAFLGLHAMEFTDGWRDSRWQWMEKLWGSMINAEVQLLLVGPHSPCVSRWNISQSNACNVVPCWCFKRRLPASVRLLESNCPFSGYCLGTMRRWVKSHACSCHAYPAWGSQQLLTR